MPNERPLNFIKSFLKINFENHVSLVACHFPKMKDYFLNNDGIVRGSSLMKETILTKTDDMDKVWPESSNNDLSYDFVLGITKSNGPEVSNTRGIGTLGIIQRYGVFALSSIFPVWKVSVQNLMT